MGTSYKDRLEGGYQFLRIRKFKAWTAAGLIAASSGLVALSLAQRGATAVPLYMPVNAFLPALLVMIFIGGILEMFFRNLSIKYAKKDSQRFLMIQNSIARAKVLILVCALLALLLFAPLSRSAIEGSLNGPPVPWTLQPSEAGTLPFDNQDGFGVTRYLQIIVTLTAGQRIVVDITKGSTSVGPPQTIGQLNRPVAFGIETDKFYVYRVTFTNSGLQPATFTYQLYRGMFSEMFTLVPGFAFAVLIASLAFFAYLRPRRELYERAAIYSAGYETRVDAGERLYSDYRPVPEAPRPAPAPPSPVPMGPLPTVSPFRAPAGNPVPQRPAAAPPMPPPFPVSPPPVAMPPPPSAGDVFAVGAALFSKGEYGLAIQRFDEALSLNPRHTRSLLAKGEAFLRLNRPREAMAAYDDVLRHDRGNLDALLGTAAVYAAERRWRDVIDLADTFLAMQPGDPEMLLRRGDAQLALGRRQEALISFEAALLKRPSDASILARIEKAKVDIASLQSRALIASASGNLDQAISLFDAILKVEPENANSLVGKSVALRRAGRVDEALASLNSVIARNPGHGGALLNKGRILEERGDLEDALEAYDKLLELNPGDPDAWVAQGDILGKMGRDDDAQKSYRQALKLAPNDEDTKGKIVALEQARAEEGQLLRELFQIKGIGPAKAKALRDAGFHTLEDFRRATEDQLAQVRGITRKVASDIAKHFHPG